VNSQPPPSAGLTRRSSIFAAKRFGLIQPRLNDLLKTSITKFSLDVLINYATLAGLDVKVRKKAA
jgi:predicted XRE-type DNA-binding protein